MIVRIQKTDLFARAFSTANLLLFAFAILLLYASQLAAANAYLGYRQIGADPAHLALLVGSVAVAGALVPVRIERPSDFLALFFGLFVILPYAALHSLREPVSLPRYLLSFSVLVLPIVVVAAIVRLVPALRLPSLLPLPTVEIVIALVCIGGVAYAFVHAPASAGIGLGSVYERRIEGREIFQAGALSAYVNAAIVNGFAPLAAFIGGLRRHRILTLIALTSSFAFFYILGLKAPLFYVVLAYLIGFALRKDKLPLFVAVIFAVLWAALLVSWLEYSYQGYSAVADYFLRRVFAVPPFVLESYFDFAFQDAFSGWSALAGLQTPTGIAYFIGEWYLGIEGSNANTNAFLYALAAAGLPGYVLTILLVGVVFAYLDSVFRSRHNPAMMFAGFLYAILLTEQAATTALLSSGVAALIVLASLMKQRTPAAGIFPAA